MLVDFVQEKIFFSNYNPDLYPIFREGRTKQLNEIEEDDFLSKIPIGELETFQHLIRSVYSELMRKRTVNDRSIYFEFNFPFLTADNTCQFLTVKLFPFIFESNIKTSFAQVIYLQFEKTDKTKIGQCVLTDLTNKEKFYYLLTPFSTKNVFVVLNEKELAVFKLVSEGSTESEIVRKLKINMGTLKYLKEKVLLNANAQSTAQIITLLAKQDFL